MRLIGRWRVWGLVVVCAYRRDSEPAPLTGQPALAPPPRKTELTDRSS